ncbi:MAG: Ig-like domain-containing protein [Myxococcota bacterium]
MEKFTRWGLIALLPILSFCGDDDGTTGTPDDMAMDMVMVDMADPDMGPDDMGPDDMGPDDMGPDMPAPMLESIAVDPATATLAPDATQALTVTGTFDDASTMTLTEGVTFASSDDAVATVDAAGLVTAVAAGEATITATVGALSATSTVTVEFAGTPDFVVFDDAFGAGISFSEFGGSTNVVEPTMSMPFAGTTALQISVPAAGYTGGSLVIDTPVDLSGYDAVQFYVRASMEARLNVAGLGNDLSPGVPFNTEIQIPGGPGVPVTTTWTQYTIPIPDPARATSLAGLFHFAEGSEEGGYAIFLDEIRYVDLPDGTITNPRPAIATEDRTIAVGETVPVNGESAIFDVDGTDVLVAPAGIGFFEVVSSDAAVATITAENDITGAGPGMATVTARLQGVDAAGSNGITISAPTAEFVVFDDDFAPGVTFNAFGGSINDVTVSTAEFFSGTASLRIGVPDTAYTGGSLVIATPTDLTAYDAVQFYVRTDTPGTRLNVAGLGNDLSPGVPFNTEIQIPGGPGVPLTSTWTQFTIPVPDPSRTMDFTGLFHFAEGSEEGAYVIFIDEIQWVTLGTITNPRPAIATEARTINVGDVVPVNGESCIFDVAGTDVLVAPSGIGFFTVTSSMPSVAGITASNDIEALAGGTSAVTAMLQGVMAAGSNDITVNMP